MRFKGIIAGLLACVALLVSGTVLADTAKVMAENLAKFEHYAGKPLDSITAFQIQGWQPLGKEHIAIWTGVNDVYLIKVATPCTNLDWAHGVGISPHMNQIRTRFDFVHVEGMPCQIVGIRKVDYLALRKANRGEGKAVGPRPMSGAKADHASGSGG